MEMAHFGVMCPETGGHLNPVMSLARELMRRGHRITFYQFPLFRRKLESAGFACRTYGEAEFPADSSRAFAHRLGAMGGLRGFRSMMDLVRRTVGVCLQQVPPKLRADGVDVLLVDEVLAVGSTLAELAAVPHVTLSIALLLEGDILVPPYCTSWRYRTDAWGILRNRLAYKCLGGMMRPVVRELIERRAALGLGLDPSTTRFGRPVVWISQEPAGFEYPRRHLPPQLHFVGPLTDASVREAVDFPFDRLDGRPLIYASLGTVLGRKTHVFRTIARACVDVGAQLVISLGGSGLPEDLGPLPGAPLVVSLAPQLDILRRAALCITHAGLNTTLECLAAGVPMVAIPMVNDAAGVAARIAWSGCGEMLRPSRLSARRLRRLVLTVLHEPRYRMAAARMCDGISRAGGVQRAADLIEDATVHPST